MDNKLLSTKTLENILNSTIGALEDGRNQIYEVAEAAREECNRTEEILKAVRVEMHQAIIDVEGLERQFAKVRSHLYNANKNFENYSEQDQKLIYEEATQVREELTVAKERERILRIRRDNLEQTFAKLHDIASKAERLVSQVGVALSFLSGSIKDVNEQITNMQAREHVGQEMLKGQEIERKRMAGALHDGPVQDLANLIVQLEICERLYQRELYAEAARSFLALKSIAQGSMGELRRIIYDLNPMTLDDLGLTLTVKNFLDAFTKQTGIETRFHLLGQETRLDSDIELPIFRIIQESLNNSRKHANPNWVEVTMEFLPHYINVEIKDDGSGFDLQEIQGKIKTGQHYGLLSMQSRTTVLRGSLRLQSRPGEGTKVLVRIPLGIENGGTSIE